MINTTDQGNLFSDTACEGGKEAGTHVHGPKKELSPETRTSHEFATQGGVPKEQKKTSLKLMNGKPLFTVESKSVINFKSGFEHKLLCDGPTFSTGTACGFDCVYCYVGPMMEKVRAQPAYSKVVGDHGDIVIRRKDAVGIMRRQLMSKREADRRTKKVIYASPLVDVAANIDLCNETVEACKVIFELTDWDVRLLSKSNLLPRIAKALGEDGKRRVIYGVSTGTMRDDMAKAFEQGTPMVSKRLESLHWLQDNGYRTFGMLCPSLPQPTRDDYEAFAIEAMDCIRPEACEHVWAEVMNVRGESMTRTVRALHDGGFYEHASCLKEVSESKASWERYSRETFLSHVGALQGRNEDVAKLRFLQYVTKDTREWWEGQKGAVVL